MTSPLKPCGCGRIPANLLRQKINNRIGFVYNIDCDLNGCNWGVSASDQANEQAWNSAPRPVERVCVWAKKQDPHRSYYFDASCGEPLIDPFEHEGHKFCGYCGGKIQVKP